MRPQQNRRMRGRNNNSNRRGPSPLTKSYESNGPDVKIRGNAQHIADRYMTLARDAQSSGDCVMTESYLQHAEHYMRIILSAQMQISQSAVRDDIIYEDVDDSDAINLRESDSMQLDENGAQSAIKETQAEIAFMTDIPNTFEVEGNENLKVDHPRRSIRQRSLCKTDAAPVNEDTKMHLAKSDNNADEEKPRKRRRSVKIEKNEGSEQADA